MGLPYSMRDVLAILTLDWVSVALLERPVGSTIGVVVAEILFK